MKMFNRKNKAAASPAAANQQANQSNALINRYAAQMTTTVEQDIMRLWNTPVSYAKLLKSSQIDIPRLANRTTVIVDQRNVFKTSNPETAGKRLKREVSIRITDIATLRLTGQSHEGDEVEYQEEAEDDEEKTEFFIWFVDKLKPAVTFERLASRGWEPWSGQAMLTVERQRDVVTISVKVVDTGKIYRTNASKLFTMWDSSRYYVLEVPVQDGELQCVGVGFNERESSAAFRATVEGFMGRANEFQKRKLAEEAAKAGPQQAGAPPDAAPVEVPADEAAVDDVKSPQDEQYLAKLRSIRKLFVDLLRGLEPGNKATMQALDAVFSRAEKPGQHIGEWSLLIDEVLMKVIGPQSPVARVLALVNQSIVIEAATHLRLSRREVQWRDVKEAEGWKVLILICPDVITVQHIRREQSLATVSPEEFFMFEWQLWMLLSGPDAERMTSAQVKISDLIFGTETNLATKTKLNGVFTKGTVNI